ADLVDRGLVGGRDLHVLRRARLAIVAWVVSPLRPADVAEALGVRGLADHDDAGRRRRDRRRRFLAPRDVPAREVAYAVENRAAGDHVRRTALPGQRPAARLIADVVGVAAGHVDG